MKKQKVKKEKIKGMRSKLAVTCYVFAAIMLAAGIYMAVENILYLNSYAEMYGLTLLSMWQDALTYVVSSAFQFVADAVILFVLGRIIQHIYSGKMVQNEVPVPETADGLSAIAGDFDEKTDELPGDIADDEDFELLEDQVEEEIDAEEIKNIADEKAEDGTEK